jgi:hypothetical protein
MNNDIETRLALLENKIQESYTAHQITANALDKIAQVQDGLIEGLKDLAERLDALKL